MNFMLITDLANKYDKIEVVKHEGKVQYILCTNYYKITDDIESIISKIKYGNITIKDNKVEVVRKIKN